MSIIEIKRSILRASTIVFTAPFFCRSFAQVARCYLRHREKSQSNFWSRFGTLYVFISEIVGNSYRVPQKIETLKTLFSEKQNNNKKKITFSHIIINIPNRVLTNERKLFLFAANNALFVTVKSMQLNCWGGQAACKCRHTLQASSV